VKAGMNILAVHRILDIAGDPRALAAYAASNSEVGIQRAALDRSRSRRPARLRVLAPTLCYGDDKGEDRAERREKA